MALHIKFKVGDSALNFSGTSKEIEKLLAKKLGCGTNDLIFERPNKKGELEEWLMGESAWKALDNGKTLVQVRKGLSQTDEGRQAKKRKSGSTGTIEADSDVEMDMLDRTPPPSLGAAKSQKTRRQSEVSSASGSRAASGMMTKYKLDSNRKQWTPREENLLWSRFEEIMKTLPKGAMSYAVTQKEEVLRALQQKNGLFKDRSTNALEGKIKERLQKALRMNKNEANKDPLKQYLKLFPALRKPGQPSHRKSHTDEESDADTIFGDSESSSSESEDTPPLASGNAKKAHRSTQRINDHNPFAISGAVLPPERGPNPTWSKKDRLSTSESVASTSGRQGKASGTVDAPISNGREMSMSTSGEHLNGALKSNASAPPKGWDTPDVIEIGSDDDIDESGASALEPQSLAVKAIKLENDSTRYGMQQRLKEIYPLAESQKIDEGSNPQWASSMALWIKQDVLKADSDVEKQTDLLAFCFTDFFYYSCTMIDPTFSVSTTTMTAHVVLVFLDLYEALYDLPCRQTALVRTFYHATFGPTARDIDDCNRKPEWEAYDVCAWAATLLPSGSKWLVNELFDACDNFLIGNQTPAQNEVDKIFKKLHCLLGKINRTQEYCENPKKSDLLKALSSLIDGPYISRLNIVHLESLVSKTSLAAKATECIAWILKLNEKGKSQSLHCRQKLQNFTEQQLILFSVRDYFETRDKIEMLSRKAAPQGTFTIYGPFETQLGRHSHQLWIMQLHPSSIEKTFVVGRLKSLLTQQFLQVLENGSQVHDWIRNLEFENEQRKWHQLCCHYLHHQEIHHRHMKRLQPASS